MIVLLNLVWLTGPAQAKDVRCKPNLYSLNSAKNCSDQQAKGGRMFSALYSARASSPPDLGNLPDLDTSRNVSLLSLNHQLSEYGPDAAARFTLGCGRNRNHVLRFEFPGYPFTGDVEYPMIFTFPGAGQMQISARAGEHFNELVINSRQDFQRISAMIRKNGDANTRLELRDGDGTRIRADFRLREVFQSAKTNGRLCKW